MARAIYVFDRTREGFDWGKFHFVCIKAGHSDMLDLIWAHACTRLPPSGAKCDMSTVGAEPSPGTVPFLRQVLYQSFALGI